VLAFIEITLIWHKKVYKKLTKRHDHDNIEYCDILTHDNHHQLFLISPIPRCQIMVCSASHIYSVTYTVRYSLPYFLQLYWTSSQWKSWWSCWCTGL